MLVGGLVDNINKFLLTPMGVLPLGSAHAISQGRVGGKLAVLPSSKEGKSPRKLVLFKEIKHILNIV